MRNGFTIKELAEATGCSYSKINERIIPRISLYNRACMLFPVRTESSLVAALCQITDRKIPDPCTPWSPREFEKALGLHPGTGKQSLEAMISTVAKLTLFNPVSLNIEKLESLMIMNEQEWSHRTLMQTGKLNRSVLHKTNGAAKAHQ